MCHLKNVNTRRLLPAVCEKWPVDHAKIKGIKSINAVSSGTALNVFATGIKAYELQTLSWDGRVGRWEIKTS